MIQLPIPLPPVDFFPVCSSYIMLETCFSCFSSKREEGQDREHLLPKRTQHPRCELPESSSDEPLAKFIDVLTALSIGKLPSQTQINHFLRQILHSNTLQASQTIQSQITPDKVSQGSGPLSQRGRKVIQDIIHVIEALLQFGMEKNGKGILFPLTWDEEI